MAVTGERFLWLYRQSRFLITQHALDRIRDRTGIEINIDQAFSFFQAARQLKPKEMILLGYRPNYTDRCRRGTLSWYFRLQLSNYELIAVVSQSHLAGDLAWVTTYCRNEQNEHLALTTFENLACAA